jgi:acetolactate synthase-1/2/3 large subunit
MERYEATNRVTILNADGTYLGRQVERCLALLNDAKRPLIIVGNGVRLADARNEFLEMVEKLQIPVVSSWGGADLMSTDAALYVGRSGVLGDRASNFAVQNADVILAIGTRLSVPQIGHHAGLWAPHAKLIMVDIDPKEMMKPTLTVYLPIAADAGVFIKAMLAASPPRYTRTTWDAWVNKAPRGLDDWQYRCWDWKKRYPVMQPEYRETKDGINSYHFTDVLAHHLDDDAIIAFVFDVSQKLELEGVN